MSWYDKILEEGYVVKGSVDMTNNTFAKEKKYRFEMEHGEPIKDEDEKYIRVLDDEGVPYPPKTVNVERDAYIDCGKGAMITCLTSDDYGCRKHVYMGSIFTGAKNRMRDYYAENLGSREDIYEVEYLYDTIDTEEVDEEGNFIEAKIPRIDKKTGDHKTQRNWFDDEMFEKIEADGVLWDIEILDKEIHFKTYDWLMACNLLGAKKLRIKKDGSVAKKSPFHNDYLEWNSYKIPSVDLELYKQWVDDTFEKDENGKLKMDDMRAIMIKGNDFFEEYAEQLNWDIQRESKVKDNKCFIHSQGLWEKYISFLKGAE